MHIVWISNLVLGTWSFFLVSGVSASVFLFFLLTLIFNTVSLSQDSPPSSTSNIHAMKTFKEKKGRGRKFLRSFSFLWNILLGTVILMMVSF